MNIYVGNLPYSLTEEDVAEKFKAFGEVSSTKLIIDRATDKPKGFGFVEMPNDEEAKAAIAGLDGQDLEGRNMKVNEARPRQER